MIQFDGRAYFSDGWEETNHQVGILFFLENLRDFQMVYMQLLDLVWVGFIHRRFFFGVVGPSPGVRQV